MCGIAGFAGADVPSRDVLVKVRDTMCHRGPDDAGEWRSVDGQVAFVHRRLSIIDLSPAGHQPMASADGTLHITFNGEIYNYRELRADLERRGHRFSTATDTEVILQAYREWGEQALDRVNGMFALALHDARERRLLLARDPAGKKPVYYRVDRGTLAFASELKALFADDRFPRELDATALDYYLAFGYVPGERCLVSGVRKLRQGHVLTFDLETGAWRERAYWSLPQPETFTGADEDLVEELERLLTDSVRLRLIADVPVGIMLSGGIDSSLITALAARASSGRIKTFTVTFPGHGSYDEAPYARTVAAHFGTDHVELAAEPASVDLLPVMAKQFDEPIADSSMIPTYMVSRLIRTQATVALGGDGGDEVFGGYPHHSWVQQQSRLGTWLPDSARHAARKAVSRLVPVGTKGRNYALALTAAPPWNIVQFNVVFDAGMRRRLLTPLGPIVASGPSPEDYKAALCADRTTVLQQATALDFRTYLVDDILVKVDRASMLASLEARAPFLDRRVIEFGFRDVPDRLRATATERKILPRRLAERLLPPSLDLRRKQGFSLPLQSWFKGDWGQFITDVLTARDADLFDRTTVVELLAAQRAGRSNTHRLYALAMVELWRRHYKVARPSERVDALENPLPR